MFDELVSDSEYPLVERRQRERSRLIVDIYFGGTDATGVASTRDIGVGGLYMNTQAVLPEGARLALRIPSGNGYMEVDAVVVYSNPGRGAGVRFDRPSEEALDALERIGTAALV